MPVNRGDGRRKGDAQVPKPSLAQNEYLDLNRLVSASFADESVSIVPITEVLASQPRQPIYIDSHPPDHLNIDPIILAQQLVMLRENTANLKLDISHPFSPTSFQTSKQSEWRCTWCLVQQIYTPTIRRGPLGPRTVCQPCGICYERASILPRERYQACKEGPI